MPVSYVSKTFSNSPYVAPLDLNVLAKVLTVKQSQFDENFSRIQGQVDAIASMDVLKGEDREYINSKLNNIVNSVNNLGGVNLSDYNVSSQIEGLASSVYGDDKVISALASTKKARSLMSSYEKMKTDPKMIKYYSEANEADDMEKLKSWMGDGQAGSSYSGPSAATPYQNYNDDFVKMMKGVIPQGYTKITNGGGYIHKESGKVLSERAVYEMAQGMLTPQQRAQMERDANYLYRHKGNYTKEQLVGKAVQHRDRMVAEETGLLTKLRAAAAAEAVPAEKNKLLQQVREKEEHVKYLNTTRNQEASIYGKVYDTNPRELMYEVYKHDYFSALGKRFAVNQVDQTVTSDQTYLEGVRQANQNARSEAQIQAAYKLQKQRDDAAMDRTTIQAETSLRATGIRKGKDGEEIVDPLATGSINSNTNPADLEKRIEGAGRLLAQTTSQMDIIKNEFYNQQRAQNPNITREDSDVSFNMMNEAMAEKAAGKDGLIKNLPLGVGSLIEQYNILKLRKESLSRAATAGAFMRPQYFTKVFTPDEQNNSKDPAYPIVQSIILDLKKDNKISKIDDVQIHEGFANADETEGFSVSYSEKGGEIKSIPISNERAKALGFHEPPNHLKYLNRSLDSKKDFVTHVQSEVDPNFVAKIRVTKIKDGEFAAFYDYGSGASVNLLKNGNAPTPAQAYERASTYIKKFRPSDTSKNKYQTKADFENQLGVDKPTTSFKAVDSEQEFLNQMGIPRFK